MGGKIMFHFYKAAVPTDGMGVLLGTAVPPTLAPNWTPPHSFPLSSSVAVGSAILVCAYTPYDVCTMTASQNNTFLRMCPCH